MHFRHMLTAAGLLLAGTLFAGQVRQLLADPTIWPPDDFIEYWAAAKLTLDGRNPYDPEQLLPLQQEAGRDTDEAVMMWNPPWTLAVVLPLGALEPRFAQLLWLALNFAVMGFCGDRLWLLLGGAKERRWIGWAASIAFLPTLFALQSGQIPPLVLLGGVLFLECRRRGWPLLAGAATLMLAIKPHLAYLVWLAILCEAIARRQFAVILGGLSAGIVAVLIPLAFDPQLLHQYADAMGNRPPAQWKSPTLGTLLREAFGPELFRLQFVPVILGLGWFAWHWQKHRTTWDWTEQLPLLLLVSFVSAPYGAWPFDMVLLLPAIVRLVAMNWPEVRAESSGEHSQSAASRRKLILVGLIAVNFGCLVMNLVQTGSYAFLWVSPVVLALYAAGTRSATTRTAAPAHSVPVAV